jgi:predicted MPP superfamily phosphohydrolase
MVTVILIDRLNITKSCITYFIRGVPMTFLYVSFYIFWIVSVAALIYMRFETTLLKVSRVRFTKSKKHLKVVHLSDIHISKMFVKTEKIKKVLTSENPDIVVLTGDYIEAPKDEEKFLKFLEGIKGSYEMFMCFGNHEYKAFRRNKTRLQEFADILESKGIKVLHNKSASFFKNQKKYNIIGLEDIRSVRSDTMKVLDSLDMDAVANIAISHNPDIVFEIPYGKVDYLLCGHFHGGQIWMPFKLEFKLLRNDKLCKMGIIKGLHKVNNTILYINRGLGNVLFPLRFLSPPEIAIIYFP